MVSDIHVIMPHPAEREGAMAGVERKGTIALRVAAAVAVAFGLLTIGEGGSVLFGSGEARRAAGHYVPFVLWFNFLAGFGYVAAGIGLWGRRGWALALAATILAGSALAFLAFGVHVMRGGAYETRTVAAMAVRTTVWLAICATGW